MKERNVTGISISLKTGSNETQTARAQYLTSTTTQIFGSHGPGDSSLTAQMGRNAPSPKKERRPGGGPTASGIPSGCVFERLTCSGGFRFATTPATFFDRFAIINPFATVPANLPQPTSK